MEVGFADYLQFYCLTHGNGNINSAEHRGTYDSQWIPSVYIYKERDRRGEVAGGRRGVRRARARGINSRTRMSARTRALAPHQIGKREWPMAGSMIDRK